MAPSRPVGALLIFCAVLAVTFALPSHGLDVAVTRWVQRAAPRLDGPAPLYVFLGDAEVLVPAVAAAGVILWWRDRAQGIGAWRLAAGLLAVSAFAVVLKWLVPHAGPPPELTRHLSRPGPNAPQSAWSFPSGHTGRTAYFAASVLRRWPVFAAAVILAMMASLVYLGDHWATDVAGGLCLGWACAETARWMTETRFGHRGR